jgi:purine-cytosine permease-like protein
MHGIRDEDGSTRPEGRHSHEAKPEHLAREVEEYLASDLEIERESIQESIAHDYSTSVVPLDKRRPIGHFISLWTTFAAGFSFLFVGTQIYSAGFSLPAAIGVAALGVGIYFAYAIFGAYLGSRTGMTMPLLTRSIFGISGSYIVSAFLVIGPLGWVGFQGGLMVQIWQGLYSWNGVEVLTIIMCGVMIFNNLFGFTGISTFARYVVTPLIMLWVAYMVIRGIIDHSALLSQHPKNTAGLTFWQVVGVVIGFAMWGNEPDIYRYGKPKLTWPIPAFTFALALGFLLFVAGGWMMAAFAHTTAFGAIVKYSAHFSLFGAFWLAWFLATISQFAINDGNYYEAINAFQNIFGNLRRWNRVYSCIICAAIGALAGYLVNYQITNGFLKVAAFLAVTAPCATTIMCVDHFLLPRIFGISRPLIRIPRWKEASIGNLPALLALGISVLYGAWATGIIPGENPNRYWGPAPLEAWAAAAVLYIVFVAITRAIATRSEALKMLLGFSKVVFDTPLPNSAVVDIVSEDGMASAPRSAPAYAGASAGGQT